MIDSHVHLWDPRSQDHRWLQALPPLNRRFAPDDLEAVTGAAGVDGAILVQALALGTETEELLELAAGHGLIAGVVGWLDLEDAHVADQLDRLVTLPGGGLLVGIRHLVQDEPDPNWLGHPAVRAGIAAVGHAGLVYDLLIRPAQLEAAIDLAASQPATRLVLDHGAKPAIAHARFEPWAEGVRKLAAFPNVACKISGLVTEAGPDWTAATIEPYILHLLECFGPERLLYGSDWPVCTLVASYAEVLDLARTLLGPHLTAAECNRVFGGNAHAHYRLAASTR